MLIDGRVIGMVTAKVKIMLTYAQLIHRRYVRLPTTDRFDSDKRIS